jgi:hypothetical protein
MVNRDDIDPLPRPVKRLKTLERLESVLPPKSESKSLVPVSPRLRPDLSPPFKD